MAAREEGFSLVEVLVVVVIISILASISIPIFFHQREKAYQAATEAALKNASTALTSAAIVRNGRYDNITLDQLVEEEGLKYSSTVTLSIQSANAANYCLKATHSTWGRTMYWDSAAARPDFVDCSAKY